MLEAWLRSYQPGGALRRERPARCPSWPRSRREGDRRMGANPHANGGRLLVDLDLPDFRDYAVDGRRSRPPSAHESTRQLGKLMRDIFARNARAGELPALLPRRDRTRTGSATSSRSRTAASSAARIDIDDHVSPDGRVMEVLSEHLCEGWLEGYLADRPARPVRDLRGVRDGLGLDDRAAHQVAGGGRQSCPGARRSPRSTSC